MEYDIKQTPDGLAMSVPLSMRSGLHARPAAKIAQEAQRYESDIRILGAEETADAKSMLDILTLDTTPDASVTFLAQGEDARQALSGLAVCLDAVQQSDG